MIVKLIELAAEFLGISKQEVEERIANSQQRGIDDWKSKASIIDFYKDSEHYIYDLIKFNSKERLDSLIYPIKYINNSNILDFGGGIGLLSIALSQNNNVFYYDVEGKTKQFAKFLNEKLGGKVKFLDTLEEVYELEYDIIMVMDVFEHLESPLETLNDLHKCINKKHGLFYTTGMRFSISETLPMHLRSNLMYQRAFEEFVHKYYRCVFFQETPFETLFLFSIKK